MAGTRLDTELRLALNSSALAKTKQGFDQISQSLGRLRRDVVGFAAGFASLRGLQELSRLADQANTLRAKLAAVTEGQQAFADAQRDSLAIAQRYATPLGAVVESFDRLLLPLRELKFTQQDAFDLTEVLAAGFALEGGSAEDAAGKIERFAMSLVQGEISAQALNQVALESPALMQALAAGLGVPIGQLRELAKQGRLTADTVVKALLSQKDNLAKQYEQLPKTVSGALQKIQNQFMVSLGEIDRAAGITQATVVGLNAVAANMGAILDGLATAAKVLAVAYLARLVPALITATYNKVAATLAARSLAVAMGVTATATVGAAAAFTTLSGALAVLAAAFAGWQIGTYLRDNFKIARDAGYALVGGLLELWEHLKVGFKSIGPVIVIAFSGMADQVLEIAASMLDRLGKLLAKLPTKFGGAVGLQLQQVAAQIRAGIGEGAGKEALADLEAIQAEADANIERIRADMADLIASGDDAVSANASAGKGGGGGGGLAADNTESFKAELKRIEQELEASYARRQITERQYLEAKLDLQLIGIDREIADTEKKRAKARGDERMALEHHIAELKALRITAEAQTLNEINERQAKSLEDKAGKIGENLQRQEERIARDRQLGRLGAGDAKERTAAARREAQTQLDALIAAAAKLDGALGAEMVDRLKAIREGIVDIKSPLQELGDEIKSNVQDPLADAFSSIIRGTRSAKEAFQDFGRAVIDIIIRIIAQKIAAQIVGGLGFAKGGAVGFAGGGSVRGAGGPTDDKIPAFLSNGEFVLQAAAVKRWGVSFLEWLNNPGGLMPKGAGGARMAYASGGAVVSQAKHGPAGRPFVFAPTYNVDASGGTQAAQVMAVQQALRDNNRAIFDELERRRLRGDL
jgi:tape measure domain-containing protein